MVDETTQTQQVPVENAETAPATQETAQPDTPEVNATQPAQQKERMYTKSEVINMMRNRVNRSHQAFFNRYKVKDLAEMDAAFGKIAAYEKQIADIGVTNAGLIRDNAYLKHNISPERYADVETYFKGLGINIDSETLAKELATHPEWMKVVAAPTPPTTFRSISPERGHNIVESENEKRDRIFGKI